MTPWSCELRLLTIGIMLTVSAWAFETLAVATILPATVSELGGLALYGWVFSAFLLTNLLVIAFAGGEIDRLGPARPYLAGIALFIIGLLVAGFAPNMPVLILGRAVQGIGSGVLSAVSYAIVGKAYPEQARPRMLALMSSAWVIPGLAGPAVAGVLADAVGWRWVFFGIVPIAISAALLVVSAIRRLPAGSGGSPNWNRARSAMLLAVGMAMLLAGFSISAVRLALPLALAGAAILLTSLSRLLPAGAARAAPGAPAAVALMILLSVAFYGMEAFIPLLLTDVRAQATAFGGLPLTASAMTWTAGSWILERRASGTDRAALARAGMVLIAAGIAGVGLVLLPGTPVVLAPLAWAVGGLGVGLTYATCQLVTLETVRTEDVGRATSTLQLAHTAAIAFATGVGGALIAGVGTDSGALPTALALQSTLMLGVSAVGILISDRLSWNTGVSDTVASANRGPAT